MRRMKKIVIAGLCLVLSLALSNGWAGTDKVLKMSTTTSTQNSGLLDILLPEFTADTGITVKVIAKGTGAAIRDGKDGNVDVIFVHAKSREEKFVAEGYGAKRYAVMHNDFIILGPKGDPAKISGLKDAGVALAQIAAAEAVFVSRGDDSGTHTKEQALWKRSGVSLEEKQQTIVKKGKKKQVNYVMPKGGDKWYHSIGQGMGKVLTYAEEKQGYVLTDRGTYIKYRFGKTPALELELLCEGDGGLANPYGVIPVNPEKYPDVKYDLAKTFVDWIISKKGQKMIGDYRLENRQLFFPDAL